MVGIDVDGDVSGDPVLVVEHVAVERDGDSSVEDLVSFVGLLFKLVAGCGGCGRGRLAVRVVRRVMLLQLTLEAEPGLAHGASAENHYFSLKQKRREEEERTHRTFL